ncbi:MAG: carbohydrate kinase family protein [Chloroflexota bacterium]
MSDKKGISQDPDLADIRMGFTVVSFGDLTADVVLTIPTLPVIAGEDQLVRKIQIEPGGAGNFLISGTRLGLRMIGLGAVGDDAFGVAALNALMYEGVDIHWIRRQHGGTTTTVFVLVDDLGKHVFLGQFGNGEKIPLSGEWKQVIQQTDAVQVWGYTLKEERISEAMLELIAYACQNQRPVCFDPGPWMADVPAERWKTILASCTILLLSETEIPGFIGKAGDWQSARGLLDWGPQIVCVKLGSQGCVVMSRTETIEHPGFSVPIRDTSAAGDAFAAGFVYAYLNKWTLEQIAAFANAMGAAKVQKLGSGRQVPTMEEVRRVLSDNQVKDILSIWKEE